MRHHLITITTLTTLLFSPLTALAQHMPDDITRTGTVSGKTGNVVILRSGGSDVRVGVNQFTRITDTRGRTLSLSALDIGDRIRVTGSPTGGTGPGRILADTIVNLSSTNTDQYPWRYGYGGYGYPWFNPYYNYYDQRPIRPPYFQGDERTITGNIVAKSGGNITIRSGGMDIRVGVTQDTRIINENGARISFSRLDIGDRVQIFGEWSRGISRAFEADTIRDLSKPR